MSTYSPATAEVADLINELIESAFPELKELQDHPSYPLRFDLLFAYPKLNADGEATGPAIKTRGIPAAAYIRQIPLKDRAAGRADVEIVIDGEAWEDYSDNRKKALIHHELYHLEVRRDKDGARKFDDLHRPLFRMRPHDWEIWGFHETAKIYGNDANEVSAAHDLHRKYGQTLFAFMDDAPANLLHMRAA